MHEDQIRALFQNFYESWYSSLVRYVARMVGSVELARDLVQESFLSLCAELVKGKEIDNPKGWTFRVVRRQISKHLAHTRYSGVTFESVDGNPRCNNGGYTHPSLRVEPVQGRDSLSEMTEHLSPREHEVIMLRLEGFKYKEIADQLGVGVATVKTLLGRAIEKMQERTTHERTGLRVKHAENNA